MKRILLLFLIAGLVVLAGCAQQPAEKPAAAPAPAPAASAEDGKKLFASKGCNACHGASGEGVSGVAPAIAGLSGSQVELADGTKVTADDAFILESITKPGAKVRKGYSAMPNLGVSEAEAKALLAYIKTLK